MLNLKTRDKILEEALRQFNHQGLNSVGVRDIARSMEISPGNLSYHFPKKEDLILTLLDAYSRSNSDYYSEYTEGASTIGRFLQLFSSIFHNQYKYRGVFVGNQEINQMIKTRNFDYAEIEKGRKEILESIFRNLEKSGQIKANDEDVKFLVSFMTLFGRFWIQEAFLLPRNQSQKSIISHYLGMLKHQLSLFATSKGRKSIDSLS